MSTAYDLDLVADTTTNLTESLLTMFVTLNDSNARTSVVLAVLGAASLLIRTFGWDDDQVKEALTTFAGSDTMTVPEFEEAMGHLSKKVFDAVQAAEAA